MNIEDFLNISKINTMSAFATEAIILELLELHIAKQGKDFKTHFSIPGESKFRVFDGYAPLGFDEFVGATAVEIKTYRNSNQLKLNLDKILKMYSLTNSGDTLKIENLLIIVTSSLKEKDKERLKSMYRDLPFNYTVWDNSDLQHLFKMYPTLTADIENNPSKALMNYVIKTGLNSSRDEWIIKRDEHVINLRKCFKDDDVVLFLGAGIALDAKIPTWNNLISKLMVSLFNTVIKKDEFEGHFELSENEQKALVKAIQKNNGSSPLQLVRFIRNGLGGAFREELRNILYKESIKTSRILEAITNLSVPLRHGVGLQGIVTYNFDDLIEMNFKDKEVISHRSIFKEADIPSKNELGIYHVHGFLPRNPSDYEGLEDVKKEKESLLVFSEEEYHELMLDSYHWANLVQLNYFRERTCLFIGISMTDPNVRRLLEIARQKQPDQDECKHYIILKRDVYGTLEM